MTSYKELTFPSSIVFLRVDPSLDPAAISALNISPVLK